MVVASLGRVGKRNALNRGRDGAVKELFVGPAAHYAVYLEKSLTQRGASVNSGMP